MTLQAIDVYPTHTNQGYNLRVGRPFPFGATIVPGGVNFSVRIGHTWAMTVFDLDVETMEYGYRMDGPWDPERGHRFDPSKILLDPYARAIGGRDVWGVEPNWDNVFPHRGRVVPGASTGHK